VDAGGYPNTLYMVHFDPKVTITLNGNASSCLSYCSANTNFSYGNLTLPAAIIPDQTTASACYGGCGGTTSLEAETLTSMQALADAVTDAQGPSSNFTSRPLAWYDQLNGQIGDLCAASPIQISANGNPYMVRKIWSQKDQQCNYVGYLFRSSFD